jgi:hypothetical protein
MQMSARFNPIIKLLSDNLHSNPDSVATNNPNALAPLYIHWSDKNPDPAQRFTDLRMCKCRNDLDADVCCMTCGCKVRVDITSQVLYINGTSNDQFIFNPYQNRWVQK